jgi:hypothetical protein
MEKTLLCNLSARTKKKKKKKKERDQKRPTRDFARRAPNDPCTTTSKKTKEMTEEKSKAPRKSIVQYNGRLRASSSASRRKFWLGIACTSACLVAEMPGPKDLRK